jgi:hypothetical protein
MSRFVRPETLTLTISDGDTLTVKRRLNSGEERALFARMYTAGANGQLKVNPFQTGIAIVTAYLLDWSLTDDGKRVAIADLSVDALTRVLDGLDPTTYGEIRQAIEAHDNAVREERAIASDLTIALRCHWRYEWVRELDPDVRTVLIEMLTPEPD